jgi:hypothetical protein
LQDLTPAISWSGEIGSDAFVEVGNAFDFETGRTDQLKKGDIVEYSGHVSLVYNSQVVNHDDGVYYQILHAYGGDSRSGEYTFPDILEAGEDAGTTIFARKVIRGWNNIRTPNVFGRLKIWE